MSVSDEVSYFSRFTVKFVEIVAAGVATAVSGYLIAHLSGAFTPSAPPAPTVQTAPNTALIGSSAKDVHAHPTAPIAAEAGAPHQATAKEQAATAKEQAATLKEQAATRLPAQQAATQQSTGQPAANPPAAQPVRATAHASHRHNPTEATTAERKAREIEAAAERKSREFEAAAERKSHEVESVEAQVRAALAKVDATKQPAAEAAVHQIDGPARPTNNARDTSAREASAVSPALSQPPQAPQTPAATQPAALEGPTGAVPVAPRTADLQPERVSPASTAAPPPLQAVEIKSRPVASVEAVPAEQQQAPAAQPQPPAAEDGSVLFSAMKRMSDLLRAGLQPPASENPRPPAQVDQ